MTKLFKTAALSAAMSGMLAVAAPAQAAPSFDRSPAASAYTGAEAAWEHRGDRHRGYDRNRGYDNRGYDNGSRRQYDEPVYARTRVWRERDGRTYCRRSDGTTGLLIGGAVGGLIGHEVAGRGDRTLGAILGVAGGALLGREIDRGGSRCR